MARGADAGEIEGQGLAAPADADPSDGRSIWRCVVTPLGLFLLALLVRAMSWHSVFQPAGVHPFGNDAFYHLRRIRYSIEHFPAVLRFDPFINHPHGGEPIWPPTLDWLLALGVRGWPGILDEGALERVLIWMPPLVGAVTVVVLYVVVRRHFAPRVATIAGVVLAVLPAHFYYSQLGFIDHHVVVAALGLIMLGVAASLLGPAAASEESPLAPPLRASVWLGLSMAACLLVWPGALLHVVLIEVALLVRLLSAPDADAAIVWSRRIAVANAVACLVVMPLSAGNEWARWGGFSALVLSDFQPVMLGTASVGVALAGLSWRRGIASRSRGQRASGLLVIGLALVALLILVVPDARHVVDDAWAWLARSEAFQAVVNESTPLFGDFGPAARSRATSLYTPLVYVVPVAIVGLGLRARRRPDRLLFVWWAAMLFAATLAQWRFSDSYSSAHALLIAWGLVEVGGVAARRLAGRRAALAALAAIVVAAWTVASIVNAYGLYVTNVWKAVRGQPTSLSEYALGRASVTSAARWLRHHSPEPYPESYAVLAPWGDGHILKYVAGRPTVQDNFGDDVGVEGYEGAEAYFAAVDEEDAMAIVEETGTRYVLVRASGSGHPAGPYRPDSVFSRLFDWRGSQGRTAVRGGEIIPALGHHRLIHECEPTDPAIARSRPRCALYEVVRGARLVGVAEPGTVVEATLDLEIVGRGAYTHQATTRTGETGQYVLRLPYPNEAFGTDVRPADHYVVRARGVSARVVVGEVAIRSGADVPGPSFARETATVEP